MPKATASGTANYRPCPEGVAQAVIVDVVDLGKVKSTFGDEEKLTHKIAVVFQIDERRDDGQRFHIWKRYTLSLHERATLRKDIETLRGRKFTPEEVEDGFETEDMVGWNALVTVVHNQVGDRTYANITAVAPLMKGMAKLEAEPYERPTPKAEANDDDIPF